MFADKNRNYKPSVEPVKPHDTAVLVTASWLNHCDVVRVWDDSLYIGRLYEGGDFDPELDIDETEEKDD